MLLAGRFRLVRPLGRGGLGEVWLAEDNHSTGRVALKFSAAAPVAPDVLRAEAAAASRLVHPNIVRVYGLHTDAAGPFIVMQAIEGGTDLGRLRGASWRAILRAILPVIDALEYAHRQGIVHRDLKAANVLCDESGGCWLTDFGVAAGVQAAGPAAGLAGGGTRSTMSPQQLDGAPASPADDVYALGALLYDLLTGTPLFGVEADPERIRHETPVLPATDLSGTPLPVGLSQLLRALLQKDPARRPAGMGAVRAAVEEILASTPEAPLPDTPADLITLRERRRPGGAQPPEATMRPPWRRGSGMPAWAVYAGGVALVLVGIGVVFYLPAVVQQRGPPVRLPPAEASLQEAPAPDPMTIRVQRQLFEETLGEFLREEDELRKSGVEQWGGAQWAELRRLAEAGDRASRMRDFAEGLVHYRQALDEARAMRARIPEVLATSLRQGEAALQAANQAEAIRQFETALAIDPGNAAARRGRERAGNLDEVLGLVARAAAAESAGQAREALRLYRQAMALDQAWGPAVEGARRLEQAVSRDVYQGQMARGYAALAAGELAAARSAFEAAARERPGDADAQAALAQLDAEQRLSRVAVLQAEAQRHEAAERWGDALKTYESALAVDPNLVAAQEGLQRSRDRADLDARLRKTLGNADHLNDDVVLRDARALLDRARAVARPGPTLTGQIAELSRLLEIAVKPVRVTFESDNLTEVVIYKVGRLGAFSSTTMELRPGAYVAVGTRQGYRDVRRSFRVPPDGVPGPIVVRCEEPI